LVVLLCIAPKMEKTGAAEASRSPGKEPPPPQFAHLETAVRYQPAAAHMHVGGDWYDACAQPDGADLRADHRCGRDPTGAPIGRGHATGPVDKVGRPCRRLRPQ
jgi:hypothetical protein